MSFQRRTPPPPTIRDRVIAAPQADPATIPELERSIEAGGRRSVKRRVLRMHDAGELVREMIPGDPRGRKRYRLAACADGGGA